MPVFCIPHYIKFYIYSTKYRYLDNLLYNTFQGMDDMKELLDQEHFQNDNRRRIRASKQNL